MKWKKTSCSEEEREREREREKKGFTKEMEVKWHKNIYIIIQ